MPFGDRKTYGQMCALAMALDRVGDRWTILIVRELFGGPARFGELRASLPGIATNLLTTRLRRMEEDGLIFRSGSGQQSVYDLTEVGEAIRPALEALGQWGHLLGPQGDATPVTTARSLAMPLTAAIRWAAEMGLTIGESVLRVDTEQGTLEITGGDDPRVMARSVDQPDAVASSTIGALADFMLLGAIEPTAIVHVEGDEAVTGLFVEILLALASEATTPAWAS